MQRALHHVLKALFFWLPIVVLIVGLCGMSVIVFRWAFFHNDLLPQAVTAFGAMISCIGILQGALEKMEARLDARQPQPVPPPPSPPPASQC